MTRFSTVALFLASLATVTVGCGPEELYDPETQEFDLGLRVAEGEDCDLTLSADDGSEADASEPQEVSALVCVGGVCTWMTGTLNGNKLTIRLPADPALIGLPVTAIVPGVGTFTGTVTAGDQCSD